MNTWTPDVPRKKDDTESRLQAAIVQHLKLRAKCIYYMVPNEMKRSPRTAARHKAMGMMPGVADLMFILPGGQAAALELKTSTGRLSPAQKDFASKCLALGAQHAVCADLDSALSVLEQWQVI